MPMERCDTKQLFGNTYIFVIALIGYGNELLVLSAHVLEAL